MYKLLATLLAAIACIYAVGAYYFFEQERWAREPERVALAHYGDARHPEALLGLLDIRFGSHRYSESELRLVEQALRQSPSFYEAPFLLARYHASRLERPQSVRAAYEAALRRYPANGRLHVAFGIWLLDARGNLAAWFDPGDPSRPRDPLPAAESHLRTGMEFEPEMSWTALEALEAHRIPPERWLALTPDDVLSRRHLIDALRRGRHYGEGLAVLRETISTAEDLGTLRAATGLALEGGDPELALRAASQWQRLVLDSGGAGATAIEPTLVMSRALLDLGDDETSNRVLEDALGRVEATFGTSSRTTLEFLCALGDEYLRRGQWVTAESLYGQAASRSPSFVPALHGMARAFRAAGDDAQAAATYEQILRLEPEHVPARKALRTLLRTLP